MSNERFLVVGGSGYLGRNIAEALALRGLLVSVFDLVQNYTNDTISFFLGDLRVLADIEACILACRPTCVIHAGFVRYRASPKSYLEAVNIGGPH